MNSTAKNLLLGLTDQQVASLAYQHGVESWKNNTFLQNVDSLLSDQEAVERIINELE